MRIRLAQAETAGTARIPGSASLAKPSGHGSSGPKRGD